MTWLTVKINLTCWLATFLFLAVNVRLNWLRFDVNCSIRRPKPTTFPRNPTSLPLASSSFYTSWRIKKNFQTLSFDYVFFFSFPGGLFAVHRVDNEHDPVRDEQFLDLNQYRFVCWFEILCSKSVHVDLDDLFWREERKQKIRSKKKKFPKEIDIATGPLMFPFNLWFAGLFWFRWLHFVGKSFYTTHGKSWADFNYQQRQTVDRKLDSEERLPNSNWYEWNEIKFDVDSIPPLCGVHPPSHVSFAYLYWFE